VFARLDDELAVGAELAFAASQGVLVERRDRQVSMDRRGTRQSQGLEVTAKFVVDSGQRKNGDDTSGGPCSARFLTD